MARSEQPQTSTRIPEGIGDGVAPVTAEIAAAFLDPRGRLAALVLGDIKQMLPPLDRVPIIARSPRVLEAAFPLRQALQVPVQYVVGRQAVLIGLVGL